MIGDDARADGIRAQQLLDDEMLAHMLARIEADAVNALSGTSTAEMSDHAVLIARVADLKAARALPAALRSLVSTGKSAGRKPPAVA